MKLYAAVAQVPGAFRRLSLVAAGALVVFAIISLAGLMAGRWLGAESDFFKHAVEVPGRVSLVSLPKWEERTQKPAKLTVLYTFDGADRSVNGVLVDAERAEGLGLGANVTLLVDPKAPEAPREGAH